jgi:hypothetical protein
MGERSGLLTRIAAMEGVSFLELETAIRAYGASA